MSNQLYDFIGRVFQRIDKTEDEIKFVINDDHHFKMFHEQSCCESVTIEDIVGDIEDLVNTPILKAEVRTNKGEEGNYSQTWTFYHFATIKGYVDIRWFGQSNGYYSEEVTIKEYIKEN
jgi:hypothetical protein